MNHFRQANCQEIVNKTYFQSQNDIYKTVFLYNGGAGQCCSACTAEAGKCGAWTFWQTPCGNQGGGIGICGYCELGTTTTTTVASHHAEDAFAFPILAAPRSFKGGEEASVVISGLVGSTTSREWVSLPQHFTNAGYLALSSGKIFHTEQGGDGPAPWDGPGTGMPPLQDPPSWTPGNFSMANVNSIAPMRACDNGNCSIPATLEGLVPNGTFQFCDRIIGDDASDKLKFAIDNFKAKAQPFFMAVGFRRPHLPFRHPQPWDQFYADIPDTPLAEHLTMDLSVPPIAHHDSGLSEGRSPYVAIPDKRARQLRCRNDQTGSFCRCR